MQSTLVTAQGKRGSSTTTLVYGLSHVTEENYAVWYNSEEGKSLHNQYGHAYEDQVEAWTRVQASVDINEAQKVIVGMEHCLINTSSMPSSSQWCFQVLLILWLFLQFEESFKERTTMKCRGCVTAFSSTRQFYRPRLRMLRFECTSVNPSSKEDNGLKVVKSRTVKQRRKARSASNQRSEESQQENTETERDTRRGFWTDFKNQREFLDRVSKELGVTQPSDWYYVRRGEVEKRGGSGLFAHYPSFSKAIMAIYPEYGWHPNKFRSEREKRDRVATGYWKDKANLLAILHKAEEKLGITKPEDWYSVTLADLVEVGFPQSVNRPKLAELLTEKYPAFQWEQLYLLKGKYAQQKRLERAVAALFPDKELIINSRREAGLMNPETGYNLELDVYIPSLNLAFEYHESHHYSFSEYFKEDFKKRDLMKLDMAKEKGISLIIVPCWWDGKKESLVATIKDSRPDLLTDVSIEGGQAIPIQPPPHFLEKEVKEIEGIGQPTTACFFTLSTVNPTNWWMFEKYDGVRGFWNPLRRAFFSRKGNRLSFPEEILSTMPTDIFLDGEIWFGRENFQEAIKVSGRADPSKIDWTKFKYMAFDIPNHSGTYEERYNALVEHLGKKEWKHVEVAKTEKCDGMEHLEKFFQTIIDRGGEGIILRDPTAKIQPGRSPAYLKHKKFRDAEARVIQCIGTQWECQMPNGIKFIAPAATAEFSKRWTPKVGDIVSFKHSGFLLASMKPKFPTIYRLREDLTWDDVVNNFKENKTTPNALPFRRPKTKATTPRGYWAHIENRRKFFTDFANERGFDPMIPENWQKVKWSEFRATKKSGFIHMFKDSLRKALQSTFPELEFKWKASRPRGYWDNHEHRRQFFINFAYKNGFDPTNIQEWLNIPPAKIYASDGSGLMSIFNGRLKNALMDAFPELMFNFKEKDNKPKGYWKNPDNRREFLMKIAEEMGKDPTDPDTWLDVTISQIHAKKGAGLLTFYKGSLKKALDANFPQLQQEQIKKESM